jgi:hypothetical protein
MRVQVSNLSGPRCIAEHVVLKHPAASSEQSGVQEILWFNSYPLL